MLLLKGLKLKKVLILANPGSLKGFLNLLINEINSIEKLQERKILLTEQFFGNSIKDTETL